MSIFIIVNAARINSILIFLNMPLLSYILHSVTSSCMTYLVKTLPPMTPMTLLFMTLTLHSCFVSSFYEYFFELIIFVRWHWKDRPTYIVFREEIRIIFFWMFLPERWTKPKLTSTWITFVGMDHNFFQTHFQVKRVQTVYSSAKRGSCFKRLWQIWLSSVCMTNILF